MLKYIFLLVLVLSSLALVALAPMNVNAASNNTSKLQVTLVPATPAVTVIAATPGSLVIPVTGGTPTPLSTIVIVGLLVIVGITIVVGGLAVANNRQ